VHVGAQRSAHVYVAPLTPHTGAYSTFASLCYGCSLCLVASTSITGARHVGLLNDQLDKKLPGRTVELLNGKLTVLVGVGLVEALPNSGQPFVHLNGIVVVLVESSPVSIRQATLSFLVLERMAIVEVDLGEELRGGVHHFR